MSQFSQNNQTVDNNQMFDQMYFVTDLFYQIHVHLVVGLNKQLY